MDKGKMVVSPCPAECAPRAVVGFPTNNAPHVLHSSAVGFPTSTAARGSELCLSRMLTAPAGKSKKRMQYNALQLRLHVISSLAHVPLDTGQNLGTAIIVNHRS